MKKILAFFKTNPLNYLLLFVLLAIISKLSHFNPLAIFIFSAIGVVPLAGLIGSTTEELAEYTGPKIGGLLNATLGNAAELIITLVAIQAGLLDLVKASITGSIIGNLLLVLGVSMLFGGLKNGIQTFDRRQSSNHVTLLVLAVIALVIPSIFSHSIGDEGSLQVEYLSISVSIIMILLYIAGLFYSFRVKNNPITVQPNKTRPFHMRKVMRPLGILALVTIGVVILSEFLVGAVEVVVAEFGLSEFFIGIIVIPLIGNVAEHFVALQMAIRNKMELSVEIAISSSLQIALFVAPILVFLSLIAGHPLTLLFHPFELWAVGGGVLIASLVAMDGELNWLEGATLVAVYLILGISFFMIANL